MQLVYIPFILVAFLCLIPSKRKAVDLLLASIALAIMISLFAFNNNSVDQFAYRILYTDYSYFPVEKGYLVLTSLLKALHCDDYEIFKIVLATIFVVLLYVRFNKYNIKGFRIALLVYFLSSYCFDSEQSRFTFAATIVVLGSFLLERRGVIRSILYLAVVVLATMVHTSCIFYSLLLLIKLKNKTLLAVGAVFSLLTVMIGVARIDLSFIGNILFSLIPNERIVMWFDYETRFGWVGPFAMQIVFYLMLELSKYIVLHNPNARQEHKAFVMLAYKICLVMFVATPFYCLATDFIRLIRAFLILYLSAITTAFFYALPSKKIIIGAFLVSFPFMFAAQGVRGLLIFNDYYVSTFVKQNEIMGNIVIVAVVFETLLAFLFLCSVLIGKKQERHGSFEMTRTLAAFKR